MCVRCIRNTFGGYGQWTPSITRLFLSLQVWLSRSRGLFFLLLFISFSLSTDWLFFVNTLKHLTIFSNSWLKKNAATYLLKLSSVCRLYLQSNLHIVRCKHTFKCLNICPQQRLRREVTSTNGHCEGVNAIDGRHESTLRIIQSETKPSDTTETTLQQSGVEIVPLLNTPAIQPSPL